MCLIIAGLVGRVLGAEIDEGDPAGVHPVAAVLEPAAGTDEIVTTKRGVIVNVSANVNVNDNALTGDHAGEIGNPRGTVAAAAARVRPVQAAEADPARLAHRLEADRIAAVAADLVVVHLVHVALPRKMQPRLRRQQMRKNLM